MIIDFEFTDAVCSCIRCDNQAIVLAYTVDKVCGYKLYYCHVCFCRIAHPEDVRLYLKLRSFKEQASQLKYDLYIAKKLMTKYPDKKIFAILYNFLKARHRRYRHISRILTWYDKGKIPPKFLFFHLRDRLDALIRELIRRTERY